MSCRRLSTGSGAENFEPRMARIYTDNEEARGYAWAGQAAMRFQISSQGSLHGNVNLEPRMARIHTDGKALGYAWASQAGSSEPDSMASELADAPVSESLTRFASGPAFSRFARDAWNMGNENTGMRLACQAGRFFGKASESLLSSDFSKQLQHSPSESSLGFPEKMVRPYPC